MFYYSSAEFHHMRTSKELTEKLSYQYTKRRNSLFFRLSKGGIRVFMKTSNL